MNTRALLKSTATVIANYSGISKALALRYSGPGTIFMLHHVIEDSASCPDEFLRCPVAGLEHTLAWLKDNAVQVVSLDEAIERLAASSTAKFCVFTFDDGYVDNLTLALPIMERFDAPFTVYVTSGIVTGEIDAWWLGLAALIRRRDRVEFPELDCRFDCIDQTSKKQAFAAINALIHSNPKALPVLKSALAQCGIDCAALARAEGLSADQVRRLAASPLVTIGAHGVRHINLTGASAAEVEQEMSGSRRMLEDLIDRDVVHFAYPFGFGGKREARIARSVGFRTAVTTQRGTLFAEHLNHRYALPREPISCKHTASSLRCKIDGTYRAVDSRLGDPVAHM